MVILNCFVITQKHCINCKIIKKTTIPPDKAGLLITIVSFVSLFFCIKAKELKVQGRQYRTHRTVILKVGDGCPTHPLQAVLAIVLKILLYFFHIFHMVLSQG